MSSIFNTSYEIDRPSGSCALSGAPIEPEDPFMATLVETDEGGFQRLDICMDAWNDGQRPDRLFSYWKTTLPHPDQPKKTFVDDAVLLNLLARLEDETDPKRLAFRFVLMLILMRKKMLRYDMTEKRTETDEQGESVEQEYWLLTPKLDPAKGPMGKWNEDETYTVLDPHLDETQIREVTEQLGEILQAEL